MLAAPAGFFLPVIAVTSLAPFGMKATVDAGAATASASYYISPSGSDSNSGLSPSSPWKTISRANSQQLLPGATISFQGGNTYSGMLYLPPSDEGTAQSPITITSYGTGNATINGGTGNAIDAYDTSGITIENLSLTGSGAATNTGDGM